jgi:hypothetical protein
VDLDLQTLKRTLVVKSDYRTGTLDATSVLTISNVSAKPVRIIPVILYHELEVTAARALDGGSLGFTQQVVTLAGAGKMLVRHLQIELQEPQVPGATLSLAIEYEGRLAGYVEAGRTYVKDHVSREFTIIRFDCFAYPMVCCPSMGSLIKTIHRDMRLGWDYLLEVTVPENLVVANGGKLRGKTCANGEITYSYTNMKPTWRIDVCIAEYEVAERHGVPAKVFFLSGHGAEAQRVLAALVRSMERYSRWFGRLSGTDSFSVIEVPSGYGSQADVTCILQESEAFKGELHFLYHEVSHLWNPPSLDQSPSRFESEGLACFMEYLLAERLDGEAGSLEQGLALYRKRFRAQCQEMPDLKDIPIADFGAQDCTEASYTKGPIAFWLLYELIGEQTFIDSYRCFREEYGGKGASLKDFMATARNVAGNHLQKFSDEWIYGTQSSDYLLGDMPGDMPLKQILELYAAEERASADADKPRR